MIRVTTPVLLFFFAGSATGQDVDALTKALKSKATADRIKAAEALGELGDKAKASSRSLCEAILDQNQQVRQAATLALEKVNPSIHKIAVALIIDKGGQSAMQSESLKEAERLGEDAAPAIPAILFYMQQVRPKAIGSGTFRMRLTLKALLAAGANDPAMTKIFTDGLKDQLPVVREECARALPKMVNGKVAVKSLMSLASSDRDATVRRVAIESLGEFGKDAKEAIKLLESLKIDKSATIRSAADASIQKIKADL